MREMTLALPGKGPGKTALSMEASPGKHLVNP